MSEIEAVSRSRFGWQGITAIVLGGLLAATVITGAFVLASNASQARELTKAKAQLASLKSDLETARNDAAETSSQLTASRSQLAEMTTKAKSCAAASVLYADAVKQVAQAMQVGISSPASTAYLLQAKQDQASALTLGCQLTEG